MGLNEVFESTNINPAPSRRKVLFWESESPKIGFISLKDFGCLVEEDGLLHMKGMTRQSGALWVMCTSCLGIVWRANPLPPMEMAQERGLRDNFTG